MDKALAETFLQSGVEAVQVADDKIGLQSGTEQILSGAVTANDPCGGAKRLQQAFTAGETAVRQDDRVIS